MLTNNYNKTLTFLKYAVYVSVMSKYLRNMCIIVFYVFRYYTIFYTFASPISAAFTALYGVFPGVLIKPIWEDVLTILPQPSYK